jgi:hypothetical protein
MNDGGTFKRTSAPSASMSMEQKEPEQKTKVDGQQQPQSIPTVSSALPDGTLIELAYDPHARQTSFVIWKNGSWSHAKRYVSDSHEVLIPYSATNNLIKNEVVLLPSTPEEYNSEADLIRDIQAFIHRYVDVSPRFEQIASYYVLFSWIYDGFNELPYLRLRGDYGSGKTRFLLTAGSLCYKPIFASGASTVSPIFHMLDAFRGTLIIDEGDFRWSDEKADIVKILNNGNVRGIPVLRTEVSAQREFNPRAFQVFGPKLVATRGYYEDRALESRFITEDMGHHRLRRGVPINLPSAYREEALHIRNKLLMYRFRNLGKISANPGLVVPGIEPRLNQIFVPLMSIVSDGRLRDDLRDVARQYHEELISDRGLDVEAQVLQVIKELCADPERKKVSIKDVTELFIKRFAEEYERHVSTKWIGTIVRRKLHISTQKSHGVFVIPPTEMPKLELLYERYGLIGTENGIDVPPEPPKPGSGQTTERVDIGDVGDFQGGVDNPAD